MIRVTWEHLRIGSEWRFFFKQSLIHSLFWGIIVQHFSLFRWLFNFSIDLVTIFGRISVGGAKHFSLLRKDSFETVKKYFQRMLKIMCIAPIIAKFLQTLELHFFFRESAWNKSFPIAIVIVNWNNSRPTSSLETQLEIFIGWIFFWEHRNKFQTLYKNYTI